MSAPFGRCVALHHERLVVLFTPPAGIAVVTPAPVAPGSWFNRRSNSRLNASTCACFVYCFCGSEYDAIVTCSGRYPRSTSRIFSKLRSSSPEADSRTSAMAISATTSVERRRACPPPAVPLRPPSFSCAFTLVRSAANAGASPHTNPSPPRAAAQIPPLPVQPDLVDRAAGSPAAGSCPRAAPPPPVASPSTPPLTLNTRLSRIVCRSSAAARAPSASRTAISRCLRMARTSIRPARLAHAISSTTATARNSVRSSGRACSTVSSCSGRTSAADMQVRHHRRIVPHDLLRHASPHRSAPAREKLPA